GRAAYLAYRAGADVARALPPALGLRIARGISRGMTAIFSKRRLQVERNLRRATRGALSEGELHRATSRLFSNYGQYWYELFRLRREHRSLEADTDSEGYEHIAEPQAAGRGVILALPHLGNWDAAGAWLAGRGHRLTVVAEPLEPPELFTWFATERRELGMDVVPLGPGAAGALLRALADGGIAALVCDRDLTGDGVEVELFGEPTTMPGGPAVLAFRSGAPIVPVGIYFRPAARRFVRILAPVPTERRGSLRDDVQRVTQDLARCFEGLIAAAPDHWLMMQPVWPSDSAPRP
ncbi:MAG: phosphatidylinositol mannoside acyltransferase, partial [Acidimicrobiia bacterium]